MLHAMCPRDAAAGYRPAPNTETQLDGVFSGFRHTQISPHHKIATVTMKMEETDRGEAVRVTASLGGSGLPVYFLPWDSRGAAVELTIPSRNPDLPEKTHPRFFFTAVLSGCSVFFAGNRQYPTIYHCGTAGGTDGASTDGDSNKFFRRLLTRAHQLGLGTPRTGRGMMVRPTDYMVAKGRSGQAVQELTDDMMKALDALYRGRVLVTRTSMWGMVFGVREERDWTFYLQRNLSVRHKTWGDVVKERNKLLRLFKKEPIRTRGWSEKAKLKAVPVALTQVYPGGGQTTKMLDSVRFRL